MEHSRAGRDWKCHAWSIVIFCFLLILPMIGQMIDFSGAEEVARIERRNPNPKPGWPDGREALKILPERTESWLNDAFGFRAFFSDLNSVVMDWIGSSTSDTILVGKDGWLFHQKGAIEVEYRGSVRVLRSEIEAWLDVVTAEEEWLRDRGIPLIKVFLPVKQTVYPEYLPVWAQKQLVNRTDLVCDAFAEAGSPWIDTRPTLIEAKARTRDLLYYKTDTHWNHRGAFVAYEQIMERVRALRPAANRIRKSDFRITVSPHGIRNLMRIHNYYHGWIEPMTELVLKAPSHVSDVYKLKKGRWERCSVDEIGNKRLMTVVRTDLSDAPRVLIVRDSFARALAPFLNESFGEILYCGHDNYLPQSLVNQFQPELVLFISIEKSLYGGLPNWKAEKLEAPRRSWEEVLQEDLHRDQPRHEGGKQQPESSSSQPGQVGGD